MNLIIPKDKVYHIMAGFLICLVIGTPGGPYWGFGISVLAGALKEFYDYLDNQVRHDQGLEPAHDVDFFDFLATVAGGFIAAALLMLMEVLK